MAQYIEAKSAGCGAVSEIPAYNIINVKDHPVLKEKVKDGSMFVWGCKNCGKVNLAAFQTLYHDPDESLMIWLMPDTLSDAEKQMIEQHMVAISAQLSSDENGELLKGYTLRRVKDAGSLIEKVNIFDAGLDDVAMEMCKYVTKMELAEKAQDKESALAIRNASFKFYKIDGPDNDITFTYPSEGKMEGVKIGFNTYEDCRGIIKRNPDVIPAPGFAIVDSEWLSTKMR